MSEAIEVDMNHETRNRSMDDEVCGLCEGTGLIVVCFDGKEAIDRCPFEQCPHERGENPCPECQEPLLI